MREKQLNKRPRTGGAFTFIAVFSTMCLSIVAALLFANDGQRFGELLDFLGMDRPSHQNELAASRDTVMKPLIPAQPPLLKPTTRTHKPRPDFDEADCQSLTLLSQASVPEYRSYENGGWECSYLLEFPETRLSSSVFIQVRGEVFGAWSNFRIKLNFGSYLSRQNLASVTVGLVDRLVGLGVSNKSALQEALARQTAFTTFLEGVAMRYWQEPIDERRFHLMGSVNSSAGNTANPGGVPMTSGPGKHRRY